MDVMPSGDIVQLTGVAVGLRVVRRSSDGALQWQQDLSTDTWPRDIVGLPDGDILVLSADADSSQLTRLDPDGEERWSERYAYGRNSSLDSMVWDAEAERLLVAGETRGIEGPNPTWTRTWVLMLDAEGQLRWEHVGEPGTPGGALDILLDPTEHRFVLSAHDDSLHLAEVSGTPCR